MTPAEIAICCAARREREYRAAQAELRRHERRAAWYQWRPFVGGVLVIGVVALGALLLAAMMLGVLK